MKKKLLTMMTLLLAMPLAGWAQQYKMAGPYEVVARDGQYRSSKTGSERDMRAAWDLAKQGKHEESAAIINAYANKLQRLDGHDAPLCLIQGYWLCRAMALIPNPSSKERGEWQALIRRAFLPTVEKFEADSPYANGNWGAIVNRFRMAAAIAMGDSALYRKAVDYYLNAFDNGALPRYISETGQCQETGRDQNHAQLGLGALCDICAMAWEQGDDLWGALDNRLLKGIEYSARYNLGYDVPFSQWTDCTGLYNDWTEPGSMGRGRIQNIYDQPYEHYVGRKGLQMPYTKKVLALQAKAEKQDKVQVGIESNTFQVPGVKEGAKLHQVFTYPAPAGAPLKHDYEVFIQPRGGKEWTRIDTYMAKVNALHPDGKHHVSEISYAMFDFTGDVYVRVVSKNRKFKQARIRPDYRGTIANVQNDSTVQFLLFQPENVSVELDLSPTEEGSGYSITDNLLVFTSKPPVSREQAEKEAKRQGRRFVYFPPGLYTQADIDNITNIAPLPWGGDGSGLTIYLEGGSYFTGTFAIDDAHDVSILGRGIARPPRGYEGCHVYRSKNVLVDGLIVNTCPVGNSDGVTLHDVRSISHPSWGDGLNVFASSNVLYDRVFCRNSDDCTTAYATRKGFSGSTRNIHMRNSTLWADVAHPIFIGLHGNPERGDTIEHLVYENIDILGQAEPQVDYQGCLAINCGDENLVRDVLFDNIRIEQIAQGCLTQVKVSYNQKYCTAPGRGVEDVVFRNIRYKGSEVTSPNSPITSKPQNLSIINGYAADRRVQNVSFEGLKINGQVISDDMPGKLRWYKTADYVPMYVGNHVAGVAFTRHIGQFNADQQLAYCSSQVDRALEALRPYDFTMMPRDILDGEQTWNLRKSCAQEWCSGFWPGILWMTYSYNLSEAVHKAAEGYTEAIRPIIEGPVFDHDLGFITINSMLKGYEMTKNPEYRRLALEAADSLATLYNDKVGTLLSWPRHVKDYGGHNTIMDNMMNLELLFWAAGHEVASLSGSEVISPNNLKTSKPQNLYDIAVRHAETTMQNHFRPDGSCYHVAVYDTLTGQFIKGVTHQGYSDASMWSRGQSWAIYGYTMVYRYTRDERFLQFAQKVTDIYLKRLRETSDDMVPLWDMDAPDGQREKDASAACVVASALLELSTYVEGEQRQRYQEAATEMLADLSTPRYQSRNRNVSFLQHSTGHHPAGSEIDASIIYADYYYLEALLRYRSLIKQER